MPHPAFPYAGRRAGVEVYVLRGVQRWKSTPLLEVLDALKLCARLSSSNSRMQGSFHERRAERECVSTLMFLVRKSWKYRCSSMHNLTQVNGFAFQDPHSSSFRRGAGGWYPHHELGSFVADGSPAADAYPGSPGESRHAKSPEPSPVQIRDLSQTF